MIRGTDFLNVIPYYFDVDIKLVFICCFVCREKNQK
jgi:hypothetical protein